MIRELKKEDMNAIMKVWLDTNIVAHNFIDRAYWEENYELVFDIISNSEVYIYVENGEILGFIGLVEGYIGGLFVCEKAQSQGIGLKLLNHAKGINKKLTLNAYTKNEKAIKFYKREDFRFLQEQICENTGEIEHSMVWERA